MATSTSSFANSYSTGSTSTIPEIIKFSYTDFKVLRDALKRTANCKLCTSGAVILGPIGSEFSLVIIELRVRPWD